MEAGAPAIVDGGTAAGSWVRHVTMRGTQSGRVDQHVGLLYRSDSCVFVAKQQGCIFSLRLELWGRSGQRVQHCPHNLAGCNIARARCLVPAEPPQQVWWSLCCSSFDRVSSRLAGMLFVCVAVRKNAQDRVMYQTGLHSNNLATQIIDCVVPKQLSTEGGRPLATLFLNRQTMSLIAMTGKETTERGAGGPHKSPFFQCRPTWAHLRPRWPINRHEIHIS